MNTTDELIRFYAKQLKLPSFTEYQEVLRQADPSAGFADLLILDESSYLSFNRHQSELLFKVISDRSEKSNTIVTTNLPFSK